MYRLDYGTALMQMRDTRRKISKSLVRYNDVGDVGRSHQLAHAPPQGKLASPGSDANFRTGPNYRSRRGAAVAPAGTMALHGTTTEALDRVTAGSMRCAAEEARQLTMTVDTGNTA